MKSESPVDAQLVTPPAVLLHRHEFGTALMAGYE